MSVAADQLTAREAGLWQRLSGGRAGRLFATAARVDVGWWFWGGRLRAGLLDGELVLFAAGSRPFVQRTPVALLRESLYNHVTGELILAPSRELAVRRFAMAPVAGQALLAAIKGE